MKKETKSHKWYNTYNNIKELSDLINDNNNNVFKNDKLYLIDIECISKFIKEFEKIIRLKKIKWVSNRKY